MEEIWKDIVHYEGLYQVSNLGRVKSVERANNLANSTIYHYFKENWQTCGGFKWKKI